MTQEAIPEKFSRDMGLTRKEFLRTLPAAVVPLDYLVSGGSVSVSHPEGEVSLVLYETRERKIASISLPVTRVDFEFRGVSNSARVAFMTRFDLCFHRGGG